MTEIRYWQGQGSRIVDATTSQVKKAKDAVESFDKSFRNELLGQLSLTEGDAIMGGATNGLTSDLFGSNGPQLMDLNIDGIEKVWAAQMDSPLSYFNNMNASSNNSDASGLSSVVDLMVKEQIAKARRQIEHQQQNYSVDQFVEDVAGENGDKTFNSSRPQSLDDFLANINQQISDAAAQYELPETEIRKRLWEIQGA